MYLHLSSHHLDFSLDDRLLLVAPSCGVLGQWFRFAHGANPTSKVEDMSTILQVRKQPKPIIADTASDALRRSMTFVFEERVPSGPKTQQRFRNWFCLELLPARRER